MQMLAFLRKRALGMHRDPHQLERTIQFSRTERKVCLPLGGEESRGRTFGCQPDFFFFFSTLDSLFINCWDRSSDEVLTLPSSFAVSLGAPLSRGCLVSLAPPLSTVFPVREGCFIIGVFRRSSQIRYSMVTS